MNGAEVLEGQGERLKTQDERFLLPIFFRPFIRSISDSLEASTNTLSLFSNYRSFTPRGLYPSIRLSLQEHVQRITRRKPTGNMLQATCYWIQATGYRLQATGSSTDPAHTAQCHFNSNTSVN